MKLWINSTPSSIFELGGIQCFGMRYRYRASTSGILLMLLTSTTRTTVRNSLGLAQSSRSSNDRSPRAIFTAVMESVTGTHNTGKRIPSLSNAGQSGKKPSARVPGTEVCTNKTNAGEIIVSCFTIELLLTVSWSPSSLSLLVTQSVIAPECSAQSSRADQLALGLS